MSEHSAGAALPRVEDTPDGRMLVLPYAYRAVRVRDNSQAPRYKVGDWIMYDRDGREFMRAMGEDSLYSFMHPDAVPVDENTYAVIES